MVMLIKAIERKGNWVTSRLESEAYPPEQIFVAENKIYKAYGVVQHGLGGVDAYFLILDDTGRVQLYNSDLFTIVDSNVQEGLHVGIFGENDLLIIGPKWFAASVEAYEGIWEGDRRFRTLFWADFDEQTTKAVLDAIVSNWDPLSLAGESNQRDAYLGFAAQLSKLLADRPKESEIYAALSSFVATEAKVPVAEHRTAEFAKHLFELPI